MTDGYDITPNADQVHKAPFPIPLAELRSLSQSERDFLKLIQNLMAKHTARLTGPGTQVRECALEDVVE